MAINFTGIDKAETDFGQYKKTRLFFNDTAGIDCTNGGKFVQASGHGIKEAAGSADIRGIVLDGVVSAGSAYVDVFDGLQDRFSGVLVSANAGSTYNNSPVYAFNSSKIANVATGLDIVGLISDNMGEPKAEGDRVIFKLTASEAIPGYDSGNTA